MPTLFKRSNGFYYISYEEDGKRRWKSTGKTLKGEAYSEMMQFQNHLKTYRSRMTLQQFTEELLSSRPGQLRRSHQRDVQAIFEPFSGSCRQ